MIQDIEAFERETRPLMFKSRFGAILWSQIFEPRSVNYEWLIKGIIPAEEAVMVFGVSSAGKTFMLLDMCMHMARGIPFHGRRVKQCGVVYCAAEGGRGFRLRLGAYAIHHGLSSADNIDFAAVTRRFNLFASDDDLNGLIQEIRALSEMFTFPLGAVVVDTFSAVTEGASEIDGKDVGKVKGRIMRIITELKCAVIVVHHKPKGGGTPRGHGSLTADFETTIDVDYETIPTFKRGEEPKVKRDAEGREIRKVSVIKQREGDAKVSWNYVLRSVEIMRDPNDPDGEPIKSAVVEHPSTREGANDPFDKASRKVSPTEREFLVALANTIDRCGIAPPTSLPVGADVVLVATIEELRRTYLDLYSATEMGTREEAEKALAKRYTGAARTLIKSGIVGAKRPHVWFTGREVNGFRLRGMAPKASAAPSLPDDTDLSEYLADEALARSAQPHDIDDVVTL